MTHTETDRTAQLQAKEAGLVLASFDHADAWRLGSAWWSGRCVTPCP